MMSLRCLDLSIAQQAEEQQHHRVLPWQNRLRLRAAAELLGTLDAEFEQQGHSRCSTSWRRVSAEDPGPSLRRAGPSL
jgi:hypothetical protein